MPLGETLKEDISVETVHRVDIDHLHVSEQGGRMSVL